MRTTILKYIEKNSRVDLGELAVLLGTDEVTVANEIAQKIGRASCRERVSSPV